MLALSSLARQLEAHGQRARARARSRRLLRIKLAERLVKCIYRNTPSPSPSPEREAEAALPEEAAAALPEEAEVPGSGCGSAERRGGALPPGFLLVACVHWACGTYSSCLRFQTMEYLLTTVR